MRTLYLLLVLTLGAGLLTVASAQETNMTGVKAHPCLLVTAPGLPALKAKCAGDQPTKFGFKTSDVWAAIKQKADTLAGRPAYNYAVAIPGEGGVTLEDWAYTLSDQTPPPHPKSPNYPPWTAMFQEREDSITTRLTHFSFAYLVTGEKLYLDKAREMALHIAKWERWTDFSYGNGSITACLDTGHCTYAMAMFYDWCFDQLTAAEQAELRQALITKGIEPILGMIDRYPPDTNGYAVVLSGATLAALAIRPEDPKGGEYLATCINKMRVSLDRGGKDGGTFEGPMYGTYLLDSLALCFDALIGAQVEHNLFDHPYLATMPRYCLGLLAPDTKQIPCFSDGSPGVAVPKLMSIIAQRGSKESAYYLQLIQALQPAGIYDFVRFDEGKLDPQPPTWNPSTVFTDIGYASLRDGFNATAPSLFFKSGPTTNRIGHNHYDHNAFVVSYGNQWLIPDRGYHSFYIPAKRKFSLGTMGHCSVVLDVDEAWMKDTTVPSPGHDQVNVAGGKISEFFAGQSFDYVKGEAAAPYNSDKLQVLDRFDRRIVYVKPGFFLIRDDLSAPQPHAYNFLLHSDGMGEIVPSGDLYTVIRGRSQAWVKVQSSSALTPHVELYPGAENYGPYLRMETTRTASANFLTCICPQPSPNPKVLQNGGFEKGMSGWDQRGGADEPNHKIGTDNPAEGQSYGRVEKSGYYYSSHFSLPVGSKVTANLKIRTEGTPEGQGATMHLYFWKGGKAFANVPAGPFRGDQWTPQSISATVPAGTEDICIALEYFAPGAGCFDDVVITSDAPVLKGLVPVIKPLGSGGMDITLGAERTVALCGTPGQPSEAGGLKTDAGMAVVTLDAAGQPARAFVQGGTYVTWQGKLLLGLVRAGTAEVALAEGKLTAQVTYDATPHAPLPGATELKTIWKPKSATLNGKPAKATAEGAIMRVKN